MNMYRLKYLPLGKRKNPQELWLFGCSMVDVIKQFEEWDQTTFGISWNYTQHAIQSIELIKEIR